MMSAALIRSMSDDAAYRAAQEGNSPLVYWKADDLHHTPFLGQYLPAGWRPLRWSEVPVLPRNAYADVEDDATFMVDASGMGDDYDPALTFDQLADYVERLYAADRRTIGLGIVEAGQFQVVLGLFVKDPRAPGRMAEEPDGWCDSCQSSVECYCDSELCYHDEAR